MQCATHLANTYAYYTYALALLLINEPKTIYKNNLYDPHGYYLCHEIRVCVSISY